MLVRHSPLVTRANSSSIRFIFDLLARSFYFIANVFCRIFSLVSRFVGGVLGLIGRLVDLVFDIVSVSHAKSPYRLCASAEITHAGGQYCPAITITVSTAVLQRTSSATSAAPGRSKSSGPLSGLFFNLR